MATDQVPVVLELAPLPREQIGPFLLLGVDKDAGAEEVEAHWAQRVIWARKNQIGAALADINWARETINDPDKRVRADIASLNADTTDLLLRRLARSFAEGGPTWQPLDREKDLADYTPDTVVPKSDDVCKAITLPEVPEDMPAVPYLLTELIREPLDPWAIELPSAHQLRGPE